MKSFSRQTPFLSLPIQTIFPAASFCSHFIVCMQTIYLRFSALLAGFSCSPPKNNGPLLIYFKLTMQQPG